MVVGHKVLVIAYNILKTGLPYQDLGSDYFDKLHPERTTRDWYSGWNVWGTAWFWGLASG
ncbi:MAG TPA: hypothetical protein VME43_03595 [Bryobacteraceae bacterium]|nr:hypothetical protein [Bryobacteraceae bacterium]